MAYTQLGTNTSSSGACTITQSATPAGALAVAMIAIRSDTATITSVTDDSGSNVWSEVASTPGGTGSAVTPAAYVCADAAAFTTLTVAADETSAVQVTGYVFPDGATASPVDDYSVDAADSPDDPVAGWPACEVTPTDAGSTVVGMVAVQVTSRTLSQINTDYTEGATISANQTHSRTAVRENAGTSATGPQWNIISGSAIPAALLTLAVKMSGSSPDPLSVDVGADQSVYVGQTASVSATPSGGTSPYTYAWTRVSGPAGSFLNANQAATSFNPTGGAGTYVLRCIVTDAASVIAQDDLQLTVSAAPAFVTIASVGSATGWTATGGTVQQVLSDTSDSTLITSQESPTDQGLDVTYNEINLQPGQPLLLRTRAYRASSSTATFVAHLYSGSTLLSTSAPVSVTGTVADLDVTFPAEDFQSVTLPASFRVVTEWTAS